MHLFKIFSTTLLLVSISLFGFCALTLRPTADLVSLGELSAKQSSFESTHSDISKINSVFRNGTKISKSGKYYEIMEMNPMYFNVRLEEIRNLSMQPRCVDR